MAIGGYYFYKNKDHWAEQFQPHPETGEFIEVRK